MDGKIDSDQATTNTELRGTFFCDNILFVSTTMTHVRVHENRRTHTGIQLSLTDAYNG